MHPARARLAALLLVLVVALGLGLAGPALADGPPAAGPGVAPKVEAAAAPHAPAAPAGSPLRLVTLFVVAIFLGVELINKVPPTLHTPLMSGSNAISGITVAGALTCAYKANDPLLANIMGAVAVATAMINVVGGFLVTDRMLAMFKDKGGEKGAAK